MINEVKDGEAANLTHTFAVLMMAHLQDPESTVVSVGVLYALCIAARPTFGKPEWIALHNAMRDRFKPESDAAWIKKLDRIKTVGWKLHDDACGLSPREIAP